MSPHFSLYVHRTPGTGLYDNLQQYKIPEPAAIFDLDYFWYDPRPFFCLAQSLYPGNYQPNYVHHFVKLLYDKGLLLRMYTQNIDGLERCKLTEFLNYSFSWVTKTESLLTISTHLEVCGLPPLAIHRQLRQCFDTRLPGHVNHTMCSFCKMWFFSFKWLKYQQQNLWKRMEHSQLHHV